LRGMKGTGAAKGSAGKKLKKENGGGVRGTARGRENGTAGEGRNPPLSVAGPVRKSR